ncbi:MAG: response regulator [Bacteroidota bacterium]|nr:response regulator [Bacteroidota bacterium]
MLIDDNKIDLFIHSQFINQMNIANSILEFSLATEALKYLQENGELNWPDLILTDIHMPSMTGFDFVNEFELLPISLKEKCKIIMVSSSLFDGDEMRAKENPRILTLMDKPINPVEFRKLLEVENII